MPFYGLSRDSRYSIKTQIEHKKLLDSFTSNFKSKDCWLWQGKILDGYGKFELRNRLNGAHIVVYRFYKGDYAEGLELDHLCRITRCVNPEHLEPVTHKINVYRGLAPSIITMYTHELIRIAIGGEEPSLCLEKMLKMPK
jgi:HNH endonuclease